MIFIFANSKHATDAVNILERHGLDFAVRGNEVVSFSVYGDELIHNLINQIKKVFGDVGETQRQTRVL